MSREHVVLRWCDHCDAQGRFKQEAKHTYTIGLSVGTTRPEPRVLEVCDEHDAPIQEMLGLLQSNSLPLSEVMAGQPNLTPAPPPGATKEMCRICGKDYTKNALAGHVWATHRAGESKPMQPPKCPSCGERFVEPQAMSMHRGRLHGWRAVDDAYEGMALSY